MVDFQSRDTRRDLGDDEEEDEGDDEPVEDAPDDEGTDVEPVADQKSDEVGDDGRGGIAVLATGAAERNAEEAVVDALDEAGYDVKGSDRRARNHDRIQSAVDDYVDRTDVCAVVTVGGTGVSPDDQTVDAVAALFSKHLPGFGEAFRRQWAETSGDAAVGSRVTAGLADDTPVFCLPDHPDAATMAASDLVAPDAAAIHQVASGN